MGGGVNIFLYISGNQLTAADEREYDGEFEDSEDLGVQGE